MIIRDPRSFLKKNIASLKKNILNLSKEEITNLIKEIHRLAQQDFFEQAILHTLLKHITKKKKYYHKKQSQSHDYRALIIAILLFVILLIVTVSYISICEKNIWLSLSIILCSCYTLKKIWIHIKKWRNPRYKEYYEKFSFVEQKIQSRITHRHKRST